MFINEDGLEKIGARFVIDRIQTQTPYGLKAKKLMKPFVKGQEDDLRKHLQIIDELTKLIGKHRYTFVRFEIQFKKLKDLSGSFDRIRADEVLSVPELFEMKSLVLVIAEIEGALRALKWSAPSEMVVSSLKALKDFWIQKCKV